MRSRSCLVQKLNFILKISSLVELVASLGSLVSARLLLAGALVDYTIHTVHFLITQH